LRGDDGAGPALIREVAGRVAAECVDAGEAPENHLEPIARRRPEIVLIVDAVNFGGAPGEFRLFDDFDTAGGLSSHAPSLGLLAEYLRARTSARLVLLGIQPASVAFRRPLSDSLARSVSALGRRLIKWLPGPAMPSA